MFRRAKGLASSTYAYAHEAAPNIQKAADFAKKGYHHARDSGLIDRYGGRNAGPSTAWRRRGWTAMSAWSAPRETRMA